MTYAVQADLEARFGTDEIAGLVSMLAAGGLDLALSDADAEIDGALAGRYTLPLVTVPAIVVGIACDIARWRLWSGQVPLRVQSGADNARKMLAALASGAMTLGLPPATTPAVTGGALVSSPDPVFTEGEGF